MFKRYLILGLTILVINLSLSASVFAETKGNKEAKFVEKVKTNITKLGTGKDAHIEIKLEDGTKLKGYISQINENSFVMVNDKTGASSEVPYSRAKQMKGNNLSTGVKVALVVGLIAALLAITIIAGTH